MKCLVLIKSTRHRSDWVHALTENTVSHKISSVVVMKFNCLFFFLFVVATTASADDSESFDDTLGGVSASIESSSDLIDLQGRVVSLLMLVSLDTSHITIIGNNIDILSFPSRALLFYSRLNILSRTGRRNGTIEH